MQRTVLFLIGDIGNYHLQKVLDTALEYLHIIVARYVLIQNIGKEVTCAELDKIIFDSDKAVAFDYVCWYLDRYPSTVRRLTDST